MSCSEYDNLKISDINSRFNSLETDQERAKFKNCLNTTLGLPLVGPDVPKVLETYQRILDKNITAEQMNSDLMNQYVIDLIYTILKLSIFIVLGYYYYIMIEDPTNMYNNLKTISDNIAIQTKKVKNSIQNKIITKQN
jgi:hypothetical protein